MATNLVQGQLAILFEHQATEGVLAPGLAALLGAANVFEIEGLVLGSTTAGIAESGISYTLGRTAVDAGTTDDGLTRKFDGLQKVEPTTLTFAFPLSGNKTVPGGAPVDQDFQFDPAGLGNANFGIAAILRACGLGVGVGSGSPGWTYTPEAAQFASCLIFDSGMVYPFIDLKGSLELSLPPGETGIATATFVSKLDTSNVGETAFPTTDYGNQDDVAAPTIELGGNTFGGTERGGSEFTLTIDNQIVQTPDFNAIAGARIEQEGREITLSTTLDQSGDDVSQDYDILAAAVAQTDDMVSQYGTPHSGPASRALAYGISVNNLNIQDLTSAQPARARSSQFSAFATSDVDGGDFSIEFL